MKTLQFNIDFRGAKIILSIANSAGRSICPIQIIKFRSKAGRKYLLAQADLGNEMMVEMHDGKKTYYLSIDGSQITRSDLQEAAQKVYAATKMWGNVKPQCVKVKCNFETGMFEVGTIAMEQPVKVFEKKE